MTSPELYKLLVDLVRETTDLPASGNNNIVMIQGLDEEVIELLDLPNVKVVNNRAEDFSLEAREQFDVVSARAVANLVMLCVLCLPLVRVGGIFYCDEGAKRI